MPRIAWVAGIAPAAACLLGGWGGESTVRIVAALGLPAFAVFAAACSALAARSARDRQRSAWICQTIGLCGWALGEAIWAYYQLVLGMEQSPFPSVADVAYLIFPVGACLAIYWAVSRHERHCATLAADRLEPRCSARHPSSRRDIGAIARDLG